MDTGKQVTEFFARWGVSHEEMLAAFREEFGPDTVWDQRPIPRITGPDRAVKFLSLCRQTMGLVTIDVEILKLAVDGDTVLTERIDTLRRADGSVIASVTLAGILTYRDGQLVYWREYFDAGTFVAKTIAGLVSSLVRKAPAGARGGVRPASS
jgi:limonene-1,2-epoxide hydrolase